MGNNFLFSVNQMSITIYHNNMKLTLYFKELLILMFIYIVLKILLIQLYRVLINNIGESAVKSILSNDINSSNKNNNNKINKLINSMAFLSIIFKILYCLSVAALIVNVLLNQINFLTILFIGLLILFKIAYSIFKNMEIRMTNLVIETLYTRKEKKSNSKFIRNAKQKESKYNAVAKEKNKSIYDKFRGKIKNVKKTNKETKSKINKSKK